MPTRRAFLSHRASTGASLPTVGAFVEHLAATTAASPLLARPTPAQRAWQDLEIGMFVHFAPNTWQDREYDDRTTPLSAITPDIDTEQWADVAVSLGARYLVFVAKHVGGFCMWQTRSSEYSIRNTPWKNGRGDVMADLAESCRRRSLGLGVYLSPRDDHHGAALSGKCETPEKQAVYNRIARQQLTELTTRYGRLAEIWFDGSSVIPVGDILAAHAADSMIFQGPHATIRWVGNELGFAPYPLWNSIDHGDAKTGTATALHGDPLGNAWIPVEVDVSMRRPNWFWSTTNQRNLLTLDALIEIYYRSVGRGTQLLLNMSPNRSGRISDLDAARAAEFGSAIRRRFGKSLGETSGAGSRFDIDLQQARRIDHLIIEEDLAFGERVHSYRLEGSSTEGWRVLGEGRSIGHRRIQPVEPRELRAVRLVCTESAAQPHIRRFAAFDALVAPPTTWNDSIEIWADDEAGKWSSEAFEVDMTKRVEAPGDYRVRFVSEGGRPFRLGDIDLRVSGTSRAELLRRVPGHFDILLAKIPRAGQPAVLRGRLTGASRGSVLVRPV